jgi:alpha-glucosidase
MASIYDFFYYSLRKLFSYNWRPKFIDHWMPRRIQLLNFPEKKGSIILFPFRQAVLEISFTAADVAEIWWKKRKTNSRHTKNIFGREQANKFYEIDVEIRQFQNEYRWSLQTRALALHVTLSGDIYIYNNLGGLVVHLRPPEFGLEGFVQAFSDAPFVNGLGIQPNNKVCYPARTYHLHNEAPRFSLDTQRQETSWNVPMYLLHNKNGSAMIYHTNSYSSQLDLRESPYRHQFAGGALRYFVSVGKVGQLLTNFARITGLPKGLPRWALHNQTIQGGTQLESNIDTEGVIVTQQKNVFEPTPRQMPGENQNVTMMVLPSITKSEGNVIYYKGMGESHFLDMVAPTQAGRSVFPDVASSDARRWWASLHEQYVNAGIKGVWCHNNEPLTYAFLMDRTLPYDTLYDHDGIARTHREVHNLYGYLMAKAYTEHRPELELVLSSSGWAGSQRHCACVINKVKNGWGELTMLIPLFVNLGLSGCPFFGLPSFSTKDPVLLVRYLQVAIFAPLSLLSFSQTTIPLVRLMLAFRRQIAPLLFSLSTNATKTGHPIIRPVFWNTVTAAALKCNDQMLVGNDVMVCPVLSTKEQRNFRLIEGSWHFILVSPSTFYASKIVARPLTSDNLKDHLVEIRPKLYQTPMLFRAGSIFPLSLADKMLHLVVFPGTLITTLYLDPEEPEHFFVFHDDNKLTIRWKRGSFAFGQRYHGWETKVAVRNSQEKWVLDDSNHAESGTEPFVELCYIREL